MKIDSIVPAKIFQPESVDNVAEILATEKGAVVSLGAATQTYFGNPLRQAEIAIQTTRLNRITEYVPGDLTIHVEAGLTLETLEHAVLENNQFLPLDPWNGAKATIGGIAATNAQGPFRATGTIRDWIIGMKVAHTDGRVSKAGGRVVKNVTGYDLPRLYTGSLGTLAIIVEISLKLLAKFPRTVTAVATFPDRQAASNVLSAIRSSRLQPVSCDWIGPQNTVLVRFGEHPRAVDWQIQHLPPADWKILEGSEEAESRAELNRRYRNLGDTVVRVIGLPSNIHEIIEAQRPAAWIAHAMNGVVLMSVRDSDQIHQLRKTYRVVIERAPLEVRQEVPTFGLNDTEYRLMTKLKKEFDPEGRLNPGRHVDGERR